MKMDKIKEFTMRLEEMGEKALLASRKLATLDNEAKNICLLAMADELDDSANEILAANAKDMAAAEKTGLSKAMLDRLRLDEKRISDMAKGLREVSAQEDPVGKVLSSVVRPNGLKITKISVPIGVIGIIYEARPNVTVDAAGICFKAGNAVILRGGKESFHSNTALAHAMNRAIVRSFELDGAVQLLPWTDREAVAVMLKLNQYIDLIIPRGGEGLIRHVVAESTIPVLKHYKGVCHTYVAASADLEMALEIIENAKCQRPSACNALETLLIDRAIAKKFVPKLLAAMEGKKVELRGGGEFLKLAPHALMATEEDFYTEYLDMKLSVKIVGGVAEAVVHINKYGSKHSDAIITEDDAEADYFFQNVDSATVYHNASTRFTDGGEFGMGAEIGISTDKFHARGPMGADELTSYKYLIQGKGQVRG